MRRPRSGGDSGSEAAKREPKPVDPIELELQSGRMRGNEALYGYVVVAEMVIVAILQLVIRGGPGAPKHPSTVLEAIAAAVSVAQFGVVRAGNRTFTALGVIVAGLLIDLPTVPNRLVTAKLFAVAIPLVYGFVLMRRSGRSRKIRLAAGLSDGATQARQRPARGALSPGSKAPARRQTGRYTPPKPKPDPADAKKR